MVGANSGEGPQAVLAGLTDMKGAARGPLMAQANAGLPRLAGEINTIWDLTPEQMVEHVQSFVDFGRASSAAVAAQRRRMLLPSLQSCVRSSRRR